MKKTVFTLVLSFLTLSIIAQWSDDPAINTSINTATGEQAIPKIATSENGLTYVAWFSNESGNYDVRLQLLDIDGNKVWSDEGLLVSNHPAMSWLTDWDMTIDMEDHAILTFQDIRNDGNNDAFAYRISPDGDFVWGPDGIELSNGPAFDAAPKVCITNANNAIFAWQAEEVIIMQKLAHNGMKLWDENGIVLSGSNTFSWPQLMPVGEDDFIMKYFEDSGPAWAPTRHVFAQRYNEDGDNVWEGPAIVSNAGGISAWTQIFPFISDNNEGFYIAWHDDRDSDNLSSTFVQHINNNGELVFAEDGVEASTQMGRHNFYPQLALPLSSDDVFVYWNEMDGDQNNRGIYGQKISAAGERLWTDNGKIFIEISSTNVYPIAARNTSEDMILIYESSSDAINSGIKAMRINTEGAFIWEEEMIDMCTVQSEKVHSIANTFLNDQLIAVWEDNRNGAKDIYGQNIKLDGSLGITTIPTELTIDPDTLFCYNYSENYVYISNNSSEPILINDIYFEYGWYINFLEIPDLPFEIFPGENVTLEIGIFVGSNTDDFYDDILIQTDIGNYNVIVWIDGDLYADIKPLYTSSEIHISPNPFNTQVNFDFTNIEITDIELSIYNLQGQMIRKLNYDQLQAGDQNLSWDGKNEKGISVKQGMYFYQLNIGEQNSSGKIIKN
jgi:hypothetical protein